MEQKHKVYDDTNMSPMSSDLAYMIFFRCYDGLIKDQTIKKAIMST